MITLRRKDSPTEPETNYAGAAKNLPLILQILIPLHVGKKEGCAGAAKDSKTLLRKQTNSGASS